MLKIILCAVLFAGTSFVNAQEVEVVMKNVGEWEKQSHRDRWKTIVLDENNIPVHITIVKQLFADEEKSILVYLQRDCDEQRVGQDTTLWQTWKQYAVRENCAGHESEVLMPSQLLRNAFPLPPEIHNRIFPILEEFEFMQRRKIEEDNERRSRNVANAPESRRVFY